MKNDIIVIGERIRRLRKQKKMTQEQLAEHVGLSSVYIRYIENAKRTASLDTYTRIAEAVDCTVCDILADGQNDNKYDQRLATLLEDCNEQEIEQIIAFVTQMKRALRS